MEASCANILEAGDTAIVCRNGYFGDRLADIASRCGANTVILDSPWGQPADIDALRNELRKHSSVKMVGVVHAETSTGVLTDLTEAIALAHEHDALVVADCVTSLGSHQVRVDEWDIDVCYSASQKCLGSPPGLAPISMGPRAMQVVEQRESPVQSFYFNLKDLESYWNQTRAYHHTSPISMTYALRESLRMMMEEGIDDRIARHAGWRRRCEPDWRPWAWSWPPTRSTSSTPSRRSRFLRASKTWQYAASSWPTTTSKSAADWECLRERSGASVSWARAPGKATSSPSCPPWRTSCPKWTTKSPSGPAYPPPSGP